jgi:prophage antirepressor-like protein
MNELQIFSNTEFGQVRTITEAGKVLFCGSDVAKVLGYGNAPDALRRHCRGIVKRDTPTQSGTQSMLFIPEGDLYRLTANSKLPGAERFERWVFDEVLPAIRATGGYMVPQTLPQALRLAAELAEEVEKQQQVIGELKPKADYVDLIINSTGTMAVAQIAADYGLTANKLNKILAEDGIQRKVGGQWVLYKEHMGQGYTQSETIHIVRTDGRPDTKLFTKWTQKGRLMINTLLNKRGIYADIERLPSAITA